MLPTLSCLSVSNGPESRLHRRCSSWYLRISPLHQEFRFPLPYSSLAVFGAPSQLSREISHQTYDTTYTLFTPSNSEQRSLPTYYRGCWHVVSRSFFCRYRHYRSCRKSFTPRRASSLTRRRCIRVSPIVQDSPLLPPVGVWPVFQCQCGRVPSQAGYRSLAWWAFTPPTT